MKTIVSALVAGALFYLSQGMADAWWFAWFAPAPLLWIAYGQSRLWSIAFASVAAFASGQAYLFQCYAEFMPIAIIGAQVLMLAVLFAVAVLFSRVAYRRLGAFPALLAFPSLWTALEFLWGSVSPNGTFAALGYSQVSAPFLVQSVSLFGLSATSFLICLFANVIALALYSQRDARIAAALGLSVCVINGIYGVLRLQVQHSDTLRVAAIADHSDLAATFTSVSRDVDIKLASLYDTEIRGVAARGARFVVTAEGGIVVSGEWRDAITAMLAETVQYSQIEIVAGITQRDPPSDAAIVFHSEGSVQRYDKRQLVPGLDTQLVPGKETGLLGQERATAICKDMDFPRTIREEAKDGVRLMAVPAGDFFLDGWIHARMAILRGVENGFAVVRAANDGLLTVSDGEGRLLASKSYQLKGIYSVVSDIPLGPGPTLYTRIGDVFAWAAIAVTLLIAWFVFASMKAFRKDPMH